MYACDKMPQDKIGRLRAISISNEQTGKIHTRLPSSLRGGRVERRCWVNIQWRGVLLVWMKVGQGPIVLAVGAGGGLFGHFFSHLSFLFSVSLSLAETARYRLTYCLKGPLNPQQPTNQPNPSSLWSGMICLLEHCVVHKKSIH